MVDDKICGKCGYEYCNYCVKREKHINVLMVACEDFIPFSKVLYEKYKKDNENTWDLEALK